MKVVRPCTCDRYTPGRPFVPRRDCARCWLFAHRPAVRRAWGGDPAECTAVREPRPDVPANILAGLLADFLGGDGVRLARSRAASPTATDALRFDEHNLCPGVPGKRFNPSLIEHGDGYALAFRNGWAGSDIYVVALDPDFRVRGEAVRLDLAHAGAAYGREDPRLFWFAGRLHVAFAGVVGGRDTLHTNVLYARLGDGFRVEAVHLPHYAGRSLWEKNWGFFESSGELYAVYSVSPHRVLRVEGDRAELAYEVPAELPWGPRTELRGGASPIRVGDEWWSFFHSRVSWEGHLIYVAGLYTFAARPPFQVARIIPEPILWAEPTTRPADQYASVVYPCGAARRGDDWVLSCGVHDRWTEFHTFAAADLERRLVSA